MAGVAVRKADDPSLQDELDQRYAQLPPEFLPTAQQIQDTISDTGIARTPQEFEQTEPLGGRSERARQGYTAKRYLNRLATEGALAEGLVRRKFPLLDEYNVDATKLPVLRDYTSRQTTLPEHDWRMQTEGPHFDEHGNILPGAIPPVNAIKRLSVPDIEHIGSAGNFGLKPVKDARVNFEWERSIPTYHDTPIDLARRPLFPVKNAGFVSPLNTRDVRAAEAGNTDPRNPTGLVAIRGFGAPSDKAFSRKDISEGREGIYTAPIPPERLVGIHRRGGLDEKDATENMFNSIFDDENIAQRINLPENIPKKDFILNEMRLADLNNDLSQFEIEMDTLYENGELSKEQRDAALDAFWEGQKLQIKRNREELPEEWNRGSFGFNNPTLTPEEKKQYERQIMEIISQTSAGRGAGPVGIQDIQDYLQQGHSPVLNPRGVKKATVSPRQYREYLEDRMFSQPIHHSIRIQPEHYKPPTLGRELTTEENLRFADSYRGNTNLPLSIEDVGVRHPLFGRHVYPNELFSINPSFISASRSDLPMSYKDPSRKLHIYGFEGKTTPQRFARNVQPEGIVYGDVPEDLVQRFTTKPVRYEDLRQAARALLPTTSLQPHELREKQQDIAAMLMSSGVAPALTSTGLTVEDPSHADVLESIHDPFTQWSQNQQRLNIPTEDLLFASEPMEIAMQLLKERVSPEAKRHKLEYDKKYESSPERVKYREELNRERRRRGIYGSHDHKDISHTEGGKLTLEGEHENRARHFKDKGTLRHE